MKKSLVILAATSAIAISSISTPSFARGFGNTSGQGMEQHSQGKKANGGQKHRNNGQTADRRAESDSESNRLLKLSRTLDLSDEQAAEIESIHTDQMEELKTVKEDMKTARQSLHELSESSYDEAAVAAAAETIGDLVTDIIVLKSKEKYDISQVLTEEQASKLRETRSAFSNRRDGQRGEKPEDIGERPDFSGKPE